MLPASGITTKWEIISGSEKVHCTDSISQLLEEGNYSEAIYKAQQGADNNDPASIVFLATFYLSGKEGLPQDFGMANFLLNKAAELGDPEAYYNLALIHFFGKGVCPNIEKAVSYFKEAADRGYVAAKGRLGSCLLYGLGIPRDIHQALCLLKEAVQANDEEACYYLGFYYLHNHKAEVPSKDIAELFRKGSELGDPLSMQEFGNCLSAGFGVAQDLKQAFRWYRRASELGYPLAAYKAGLCFAQGIGVAQNDFDAAEQFRRAAQQQHPEAKYRLAHCYLLGKGVAPDQERAFELFREAADEKCAKAIFSLAEAHLSGWKVVQDHRQAWRLFLEAHNLRDFEVKKKRADVKSHFVL